MRFLLVVALAAITAASQVSNRVVPQYFQPNREYIYEYRSLVAAGLPRFHKQQSGVENKALLSVQVQEPGLLALQLVGSKQAAFDKEIEDLTQPIENVYHKPLQQEQQRVLQGPVFVRFQNNQVQSIKAPADMPEKVINLYRGIASILTVSNPVQEAAPFRSQSSYTPQEPIVYRLHEDGVTGQCETIYEVLSDPTDSNSLNITKSKNFKNCIGAKPDFVHSEHDSQGCSRVCLTHKPEQISEDLEPEMYDFEDNYNEGCPASFHPQKDLAESFLTVRYNISSTRSQQAVIESIQAIDKKIMPLRLRRLVATSILELTLQEQRSIQQKNQIKGASKKYNDLIYRFPTEHYQNSQKKLDVEYLSLFGPIDRVEMKRQVIHMLDSLADFVASDNIEAKARSGDKIIQLTMALAALQESDLKEIWQTVINVQQIPKATEKEYIIRKTLIDLLSIAGSDDAAEVVLQLIKNRKLTSLESIEALQAMQNNLVEPGTDVMDLMLQLVTDETIKKEQRALFSTSAITLAEVVSDNCQEHDVTKYSPLAEYELSGKKQQGKNQKQQLKKQQQQKQKQQQQQQQRQSQESSSSSESDEGRDQDLCDSRQYKKYIKTLAQQLHQATENYQVSVLLEALGRFSHPDAVKEMLPYIQGEQEVYQQVQRFQHRNGEDESETVQFLRQIAIYALHHTVQEHAPAVQPIAQSIYFNEDEDYEIRNAALTLLLATNPPEPIIARLVAQLGSEDDQEVSSFTYSALMSIANSTIPCMQQTAQRVKNVVASLPRETYGFQQSRFHVFTEYHQKSNAGIKAHINAVQSNVSAIPRSTYFGITYNKGPYISTLADIQVIAKGIENLDSFILKKGGPASILSKALKRVRRALQSASSGSSEDSISSVLEQIEKSINFNVDNNNEEPKAAIAASVLGNDMFLPLDKKYVSNIIAKAAQTIQEMWVEPVNRRYVRILMPHSYVKVSPSISGLPVVMTNRHPIVMSVALKDLKARYEPQRDTWVPDVLAISALIQPSIRHTAVTSMLTITPQLNAHGVRITEQTKATYPLDLAFQYSNDKQTLSLTFKPRFIQAFNHKSKVVTFKTAALIVREPNAALLDHFTVLKAQSVPFELEKRIGHRLFGMGLRIDGYSHSENFDTNPLHHPQTIKKSIVSTIARIIANPWVHNREWVVRTERSEEQPINDVKLTLQWRNNLLQNAIKDQSSSSSSSSEENIAEDQYPEELQQPDFEREFKQATGQQYVKENLDASLQSIAQKTQQYWSNIDSKISQSLKKENTYARRVQFVLAAEQNNKQLRNRAIVGHATVAGTFDKQIRLADIYVNVQDKPYEMHAQGVVAYTPIPNEFQAQIPNKNQQRGVMGAVIELETPQSGKQQYAVKVDMKKSQEQIQGLATEQGSLYKPWYVQQCEQDRQQNQESISDACRFARLHRAALNDVKFELQLPQKTPQFLKNVTHHIREHLKVILYRNLRADYTAQTDSNKIEGRLVISEQVPQMKQANLTILTPDNEKLVFQKLYWPKFLRPSTAYTLKQQLKSVLQQDHPFPICAINNQYIKTFDNITYSLQSMKRQNEYILAREDSDEPDFTIILDPSQQGSQQEVKILLTNTTLIVLSPPSQKNQATYSVQINSTEVPVTSRKAQTIRYDSDNDQVAVLFVTEHENSQDVLHLQVKDQGLQIAYDGQNIHVKIQNIRYKGQVVGLCGDMNGQYIDEMTGPRGCVFEQEQDFIRSYAFEGQIEGPQGEYACPAHVHPRGASQSQQLRKQQQKQQQQKQQQQNQRRGQQSSESSESNENQQDQQQCKVHQHQMIEHKGNLCFSQDQVASCRPPCRRASSRRTEMAFICISKDNAYAQKLQRQLQNGQRLSAIPPNVRSTFHKEITEAKKCQL